MTSSDIKEVIITLIKKGRFCLADSNEDRAREIAKFEKAYFNETEYYNTSEVKEIIITLIEEGKFYLDDNNEEIAREIAKFEKAYLNEKNSDYGKIDTDYIFI